MAIYIPTDPTSRFLAREYLVTQIRAELERGNLNVTIGEMAADGTYPVYLRVQQAEFDFRTMLDTPQIDGIAWVEDNDYARVEYSFPGTLQPYTFMQEQGALA